MLYNNNEKVILELKEKFIKSNLLEKYLLLNELTNNIAAKDSIPFYKPSFNRYSVILNNILDDLDSGADEINEKKILRLIVQYSEIIYRDLNKHKKYQIILVGNIEDCENAEEYINNAVCHIVGYAFPSKMFLERNDIDYFIICGDLKNITETDKRIIRWDFIRFCNWRISPESAYINLKLKKQQHIRGAVTGLSYEQTGINWDTIDKNLCCLATPSQDLFVDYHKFVWLHKKYTAQIKYCIIGMTDYALWYDLSLSKNRIRMLCSYDMIKNTHNFHDYDNLLLMWDEYKDILKNLLIKDYNELEYEHSFHPEKVYIPNYNKYTECNSEIEKDLEEIKHVFSKPYEKTFIENKQILIVFLKYLTLNKINTLIYFPPFPKIFRENTDISMKRITRNFIFELQKFYHFNILDLTDNPDFTDDLFFDWCHLNAVGADLATEKLNSYMNKIW